jgi:hypothetical protein
VILNLDALRDEANRWLLDQRSDRALPPDVIAYFRSRFCLPQYIMDLIRRDDDRERDGGALVR